jgi:hypothetical protein
MADDTPAPDTGTDDTPSDDPTPDQPSTPAADTEPDSGAETEKWKALAKKHEARAKANANAAKELEKLKADQMSETEKAVNEAEARGRKAGTAAGMERLAAAEIKVALTGVVPDPASIVEDLNLARYLDEDGEIDADKVAELKAKYEAMAKPAGDVDDVPGSERPKERLGSVRLPNSESIRLDDETDPRKLAANIRRL